MNHSDEAYRQMRRKEIRTEMIWVTIFVIAMFTIPFVLDFLMDLIGWSVR